VLDRRLPARLNEVSDKPEGTATSLLKPNLYLVGAISGTNLEVTLDRTEDANGPIWLFSTATLKSIPEIFEETNERSIEDIVPAVLANYRVAGIVLYELIFVFIGLPVAYLLTGLLNPLLATPVRWILWHKSSNTGRQRVQVLPPPFRLLILAGFIRWLLSAVTFPLIARQLWSSVVILITICAITWLLMLLNGRVERYVCDRLQNKHLSGTASVQRLIRRSVDLIIIAAGALIALAHFGINPTAALAGLGVGGIAIALAAQKTLENVVGGVSLIVDKAVAVGDFLKVGDVTGTVDDIGLRSIRIRTLDRTMVVIPNGQLANMNLEVISSRDKFWFHPTITLRYETTSAQIASVADGVRSLLTSHPHIDVDSVRVRFFQLASFSLNIDVFAYVFAADWNQFLRIQEDLLHRIMAIAQQVGAEFAFPSQTMYLVTDSTKKDSSAEPLLPQRLPEAVNAASAAG
jgi:MscS family membrane protein